MAIGYTSIVTLCFSGATGSFAERKQKEITSDVNQRTNGPVNAHLRPEIYTCTNKLVRLEWYNACI